MATPDFNLLVTLDVLLAEGSVARAAQRLRLSPSAMSRALARLRGRRAIRCWSAPGAVSFPHPERSNSASGSVGSCRTAEAVLRPAEKLDLKNLDRTFTLRTREGFVEIFGPDSSRASARTLRRAAALSAEVCWRRGRIGPVCRVGRDQGVVSVAMDADASAAKAR